MVMGMKIFHVAVRKNVVVMDKIAKIKKEPNKNKWTVYSEKGRPMGTYGSLELAKKR